MTKNARTPDESIALPLTPQSIKDLSRVAKATGFSVAQILNMLRERGKNPGEIEGVLLEAILMGLESR